MSAAPFDRPLKTLAEDFVGAVVSAALLELFEHVELREPVCFESHGITYRCTRDAVTGQVWVEMTKG